MARRRRRRREGGEYFAQWTLGDIERAAAIGGPVAVAVLSALRAWRGDRKEAPFVILDSSEREDEGGAPKVETLAELLGMSVRSCQAYLRALEDAGEIEATRLPGRKVTWTIWRVPPGPGRICGGVVQPLPDSPADLAEGPRNPFAPAHPQRSRDLKEAREERPPEKGPARRGRPSRRRDGPADAALLKNNERKLRRQAAEMRAEAAAKQANHGGADSGERQSEARFALVAAAPPSVGPDRAAELARADELEEENSWLGPEELALLRQAEGGA